MWCQRVVWCIGGGDRASRWCCAVGAVTACGVFPKGAPERGESLERAALREVGEETGLRVSVREPLGSIRYQFTRGGGGVRFQKTVYHFLMRASGGSVEDHDEEYDRVQWFPAEEALRLLTFPNEAEVVRRAVQRLEGDSGEAS